MADEEHPHSPHNCPKCEEDFIENLHREVQQLSRDVPGIDCIAMTYHVPGKGICTRYMHKFGLRFFLLGMASKLQHDIQEVIHNGE